MTELTAPLNPDKCELIDYVFGRRQPQSRTCADLGGVWRVEGGYTFYALSKHNLQRAILVDTNPTDVIFKSAERFHAFKFIKGNFGYEPIRDQVGQVGAIFLFDVLLHQVKPDWDDVLKMYAKSAEYICIFNQQWTRSKKTIRLMDLGEEEYFRNVPHDRSHARYSNLFTKLNEMNIEHGRIWRDIHNVWQWGITDVDLRRVMMTLGYRLLFYKNCGQFGSLPYFENHAFVFMRK